MRALEWLCFYVNVCLGMSNSVYGSFFSSTDVMRVCLCVHDVFVYVFVFVRVQISFQYISRLHIFH